MNKTVLKIFISFSFIAAFTAVVLLCINALGLAFIASDTSTHIHGSSPQGVLEKVGNSLEHSDGGFYLPDGSIVPEDYWCILLNEGGDIIWSQNQPEDIPMHYSIKDIAKLTRWFLNDYPVYVRTEDYGLLILGIPKNAVGKYDMTYSMAWFDSLPQRIIGMFILNIVLALILAFIFGNSIYKNLKRLTAGINDLKNEKTVKLSERGLFKELSHNLNETSNAIERKNHILAARDSARVNWVAGISHDIRTPLAIIMGNSEALEISGELSGQNIKKAASITAQSIKIKKLIEDLNLISSLEYDMQPSKKQPVRICPIIREIVTDICNSMDNSYNIDVELTEENVIVWGDSSLIERAIFNIINNSIVHNKNGCDIIIREYAKNSNVLIEIADNGIGIATEVIDRINEIPKSKHGFGLPMTKKIVEAHGGSLAIDSSCGCRVIIELPIETRL